jgi:sigma-B regulation protein RsbU (phosphoserine phosphatase)
MDETDHVVNALTSLLMSRRPYFEKLADYWLSTGATYFELAVNGSVLACWEKPGCRNVSLVAPLEYGGDEIGWLKVYGLDDEVSHMRLKTDAEALEIQVRFEFELEMLTSELVQGQDQLLAFYELSRSMRRYLNPEDTLATLCSEAARLCNCQKAFAILTEPGKPASLVTHPESFINVEQSLELLEKTIATGRPLVLNSGYAGARNLLFLPILINNQPVAGLGLANHRQGFTAPLLKLAHAITQQGGAQLENSILYQETLAQARLKSEMELAASIQLQLLPQTFPEVSGLEIYAAAHPAREMGGDFYYFSDKVCTPFSFMVGDVSGKGASAALMMAMARIVVRNAVRYGEKQKPEQIMQRVNEDLYDDCTELSMFITAFYGQYETATRRLSFVNAGHSPVIYCPVQGQAVYLEADGPGLGVLPDILSERQDFIFDPGDILVVATDGFTEAFNSEGEMYGYEKLLELVNNSRLLSAKELTDLMINETSMFEAGTAQSDDRTLIVLKGC